ncbi:Counting factor 50 protein [Lachnellula hyalina]|uniref:Counting factor 50 protein n=1 Tax=Lachnellula hyalina TaxID=1316788 RepID=A0A8H8QWM9_9HELO|nr:Counting factor 50 protein [Lachnellula hyalina]TVY24113.1 Counting factor 50 protein [Lachnellula hyalina]
MHFSNFILGLATTTALSSAHSLIQKRATTSCTTPSGPGFCSSTSTACTGGTYVAGHCPGAADIQCCVATCSAPAGQGVCEPTSNTCAGTFVGGLCPGPSDVQCCPSGGSGGGSGTGVAGIDVSSTPPSSFWSCAAGKYKVVALEGYIQACGSGGAVKSNFAANYKAAQAAGISRIDAYLFPCTGTQSNGVACKSPATQLQEFLNAVDSNGMTIGHYWFDIEPTSTANGDACNAWNLGSSANAALAKQWVAALQGSGRKWGIYANGNQWTSMFASRSTDIGSQLPLWAVQFDNKPGVNTVTSLMGGWTSAVAKQYTLDTTTCGSGADLDSFST